MTDETTSAAPAGPPAWYWLAAIAALLFECLSCYIYLEEVRLTPEQIATLPLDQAALLNARPDWYYAAFAVSVWVGLVGSIGLLLRRAWAVPLLLTSLAAVIVQYSAILIVPDMRTMTSDALLGPLLFVVIYYGIYMLGRRARRRDWLR